MSNEKIEKSMETTSKSKIDFNIIEQSVQGIQKKYEEIAEEPNPLKDYSIQRIRPEDLIN